MLTPDQFAPSRKRGGCSLGKLLRDLDPDESAVLAAALADENVDGARVAAVLNAEGYDMGESTVNRHRRGGCKC